MGEFACTCSTDQSKPCPFPHIAADFLPGEWQKYVERTRLECNGGGRGG